MYHKRLTIRQLDGIYRILSQRARTIHRVDLADLPEDVFHYIVDGALQRVVRRKRWNLNRALEFYDLQLIAYLARRG